MGAQLPQLSGINTAKWSWTKLPNAIRLLFLPPYSPNLNLIERLWKFIKKDCLNGRYYPTHQLFHAAILDNLKAINTRHKDTLKNTLTLNFQMFDKVQLLAA